MARIRGNPRSASASVPGPARSYLAVIGFSDNAYGALTNPRLTTVHIDAEAEAEAEAGRLPAPSSASTRIPAPRPRHHPRLRLSRRRFGSMA